MAYLRTEKELIEIDYSIDIVWAGISKAISTLQWEILKTDELAHQVKAKTKSNFMAYASTMTISATFYKEKTTRVSLSAETPVTTITGIVDFGRTRERIDSFMMALMAILTSKQSKSK